MNTALAKQQSVPSHGLKQKTFLSTQQGDLPLVTTCKQSALLEIANNMEGKHTAAMNFKNLSSDEKIGDFSAEGAAVSSESFLS